MGDFNFIPTAVASSGLDALFTSSDSWWPRYKVMEKPSRFVLPVQPRSLPTNPVIVLTTATAVTQTLTVGYFNLQETPSPVSVCGSTVIISTGTTLRTALPNNTAIIQWIDRSGNNHAGQATAGNRPTYQIRGTALNSGMSHVEFTASQSFNTSDANIRVIVAVNPSEKHSSKCGNHHSGRSRLLTVGQKFSWCD